MSEPDDRNPMTESIASYALLSDCQGAALV